MGPRKKARLDNTATADNDSSNTPELLAASAMSMADGSQKTDKSAGGAHAIPVGRPESLRTPKATGNNAQTEGSDSSSIRSLSGLYGSWKSKAPPTTQIDGNNITTTDRPRAESRPSNKAASPSPSRYLPNMPNNSRRSSKSVPIAASTTKVHATSGTVNETRSQEGREEPSLPPLPPDPSLVVNHKEAGSAGDGADPAAPKEVSEPAVSSWRGWWSRPDNASVKDIKEKTTSDQLQKDKAIGEQTPLPDPPNPVAATNPSAVAAQHKDSGTTSSPESRDEKDNSIGTSSQNRLSWFYFWSRQQNAEQDQSTVPTSGQPPGEREDVGASPEAAAKDSDTKIKRPVEPDNPNDLKVPSLDAGPKSSGWAFWSKDKSNADTSSDTDSTHKQVGELAVADTPSQSRPEAAQFNEHDGVQKGVSKTTKAQRGRETPKGGNASQKPSPQGSAGSADTSLSKGKDDHDKAQPQSQTVVKSDNQSQGAAKLVAKSQDVAQSAHQRNIILPQFQNTYHAAQTPSYWEQLRRLLWSSGPAPPRIFYNADPPRIQRALAIGVHGFFPAAMFRTVLGQPTGTSIRFANLAAAAIKDWVKQHGDYECEIEKAALEGEGFIADRVDILWKLLLNWMDKIRKADLIMVAAHSQGVPVAVMLVSKLIQFGCVNSSARIGICAMAGVNMGPFIEYRTTWLGGTANELFEFSRPDSKVSLMYEEALGVVLGHGVRISYIGSIDDQLVSLESSTFTPITHPYIYRAVFVDSRLQQKPDFIATLVGFVLKLRNLGVPDHGLIRELSPALAGSLVSGDGHSRLYDDLNVYLLAVRSTLETTTLPAGKNPPIERLAFTGVTAKKTADQDRPNTSGSAAISANTTTASANPYFLPWAMRGVLEEELVRKSLGDECTELLALFEKWKPTTKGLKDVRFRLEAVRSKL